MARLLAWPGVSLSGGTTSDGTFLRGATISCEGSPSGLSPGARGAVREVRALRAVKPATAAGVASSETAADCASVATSALTAGAVVSAAAAAAGFSDAAAAAVIDRSAPINADRPSGAPAWPTAAAAAAAEKPAPCALRSSLLARDFFELARRSAMSFAWQGAMARGRRHRALARGFGAGHAACACACDTCM